MKIYAGLDVSDTTTHICSVDSDGTVLRRDVVASDPDVVPIKRAKRRARLHVALATPIRKPNSFNSPRI